METINKDQIIKDQQKEIEALKKKLEDRNPAFNGNLLRQANIRFFELQESVGKSIQQTVGNDLLHILKYKRMFLDLDTSSYGGRGWIVSFDSKDENEIKGKIADIEMRKFQETLDNYAWAVNNK